jgi:hypothetical protein
MRRKSQDFINRCACPMRWYMQVGDEEQQARATARRFTGRATGEGP